MNFQTLEKFPAKQIAEWIRPAGYFNQKAGYLKAFAEMLVKNYGGSLDRLFKPETPELRKTLLSVKGIGPETADSILLYAAKRPVFVVDAYTRRFLAAHGYKKMPKPLIMKSPPFLPRSSRKTPGFSTNITPSSSAGPKTIPSRETADNSRTFPIF